MQARFIDRQAGALGRWCQSQLELSSWENLPSNPRKLRVAVCGIPALDLRWGDFWEILIKNICSAPACLLIKLTSWLTCILLCYVSKTSHSIPQMKIAFDKNTWKGWRMDPSRRRLYILRYCFYLTFQQSCPLSSIKGLRVPTECLHLAVYATSWT